MSYSIGVIGPNRMDSLEFNIVRAAHRLGHRASVVGNLGPPQNARLAGRLQWLSNRIDSIDAAAQDRLVRKCTESLDLLIVTISSAVQLRPSSVAALKTKARRVVCWYVDHVANLGRGRFMAAPYDAIFLTDVAFVSRVGEKLEVPAHLLPEGCDTQYHTPNGQAGARRHVAVVGTYRTDRISLLRRLHADGVPLRLYGAPLPSWARGNGLGPLHAGEWVVGARKAEVFNTAAAVLNDLSPAELDKVNCRTFEAAASGAVVVSEDRPLLGQLFEPGRDVIAYRTYGELVGVLRDVLDNRDSYLGMRARAHHRAHSEHSLDARLLTMLERVGL